MGVGLGFAGPGVSAARQYPPAVAADFVATDYPGSRLWLRDSAGKTLDGSNVMTWASQGGFAVSALPDGVAPAVGPAVVGRTSVAFDGATTDLTISSDVVNMIAPDASEFTICAAVIVDEATEAGSYGAWADNNAIFCDTSQYVVLGVDTTAGGSAVIAVSSGGSYKVCKVPVAAGEVHVISARLGGGTLRLSVDGGADVTIACGALDGHNAPTLIGFGHGKYFHGKALELSTFDQDHTGTINDAIVSALLAKWKPLPRGNISDRTHRPPALHLLSSLHRAALRSRATHTGNPALVSLRFGRW